MSKFAAWIGSEHPFDLHEAYLRFQSPAAFRLVDKRIPVKMEE